MYAIKIIITIQVNVTGQLTCQDRLGIPHYMRDTFVVLYEKDWGGFGGAFARTPLVYSPRNNWTADIVVRLNLIPSYFSTFFTLFVHLIFVFFLLFPPYFLTWIHLCPPSYNQSTARKQ